MAKCEADRKQIRQLRKDFKPLLVGFHWPSQPWGDEEIGVGSGASFAAPGGEAGSLDEAIAHYVELYADRIADTPAARAALTTIFKAAAQGNTAGKQAAAGRRRGLPRARSGIGARRRPDQARRPATIASRSIRTPRTRTPSRSRAKRRRSAAADSRRLLSPLRQLSFWKMKDRARTLGESAGFSLLAGAQQAVPAGRDVRFHLMGHSFGCIVMSGFLNGRDGTGALRAPVHSLTLVQGATSLWGYCNANPPLTQQSRLLPGSGRAEEGRRSHRDHAVEARHGSRPLLPDCGRHRATSELCARRQVAEVRRHRRLRSAGSWSHAARSADRRRRAIVRFRSAGTSTISSAPA